MTEPYLLDGPIARLWWPALIALDAALANGDAVAARAEHARVTRALLAEGSIDLADAMAGAVLFGGGTWSRVVSQVVSDVVPEVAAEAADEAGASAAQGRPPRASGVAVTWPRGVAMAARADLQRFAHAVRRDWAVEVAIALGREVPAWQALAAPRPDSGVERARSGLAASLLAGDAAAAWQELMRAAGTIGAGPLARFEAYTWEGDALVGLQAPAAADLSLLVGLERPLARLTENVEAFLLDRPALATLLYGPRGSGKSTAVRGLLERYSARGLRLVELPGDRLDALPALLEALRPRPHHHVLYLDDLAFDADDLRTRPLKSLLEGSLRARPRRVLVVATSNRRHLVRERHGDRPQPGDDDVHAWDTHHDQLALADRFGLTITFPGADRSAYLAIVRSLAQRAGTLPEDLEERALRFATWGNGFSGRTARQFVDTLVSDEAAPRGRAPRRGGARR